MSHNNHEDAAALRQQAGRVDDPCRDAWFAVCDALSDADPDWMMYGPVGVEAAVAKIRALAALAQNTQGEAVAWQYRDVVEGVPSDWQQCTRSTYLYWSTPENAARGVAEVRALYLHAERARVPEPRAHQWDRDGERCVVCGDKDWMGGPCNGPRTAAPSQRAEVK